MKPKDNSTASVLKRAYHFRYSLVLEGIAVGILAGLVISLFRWLLSNAEILLANILAFGQRNAWFIPVWFVILTVAALIVNQLLHWAPLISGSGIPQVEGEMQGMIKQKWWRVLIAKFFGSLLTIGAGLSLGREGPSIQLGAMVGKGFAKITRRIKMEERLLLTCGASAGLSAAFNAPLAGVLFSLEELHKNFSPEVLLSTMAASISANFISANVFGLQPVFTFQIQQHIPLHTYGTVILLGILLGLLGAGYNLSLIHIYI